MPGKNSLLLTEARRQTAKWRDSDTNKETQMEIERTQRYRPTDRQTDRRAEM